MIAAVVFAREQLRAPLTLALLIGVPALFVVSAAESLSDFAGALGGDLASDSAIALSAGWAAAFLSGSLGFFQAASSRGADRRLALAGFGATRLAASRVAASVALVVLSSAAALVALALRIDLAHPWHAAAAILAFAVIYLGIGVVVGSLIAAPLEGSLVVVLIFLLDAFAGPGMVEDSPPWAVSQGAAEVLLAAGAAAGSPQAAWSDLGLVSSLALSAAIAAFALAARSRA